MANPKNSIRRLVKSLHTARLTEAERLARIAEVQKAAQRQGQAVRKQKAPPARSA